MIRRVQDDFSERDMPRRIEREFGERRRLVEAVAKSLGRSAVELEAIVRRNSRKRPPGMAPALVESPHGPRPMAGGAAAALEFRED